MNLKIATREDLPKLLEFCKNFYDVSGYNTIRYNKAKMRKTLEGIIDGGGLNSIAIMALYEGEPVGMVLGAAGEPTFSDERLASEIAWWIEPEYRGSRLALTLFDAYEEWARRVGCTHIQSAYLVKSSPKGLEKFYSRKGYRGVENSFLKKIKQGV